MLAALFAILSLYGLISLITLILKLATAWKVFVKYGEPGWLGLIPFVSDYFEYGKVWSYNIGLAYIVLYVLLWFVPADASGIAGLIFWIMSAAMTVLSIIFAYKKSKAFGMGVLMAILLFFFPFIGNLIIGFGSAKFVKKDKEL